MLCAYCGEDEARRRFLVLGNRDDARICDACLHDSSAMVARLASMSAPRGSWIGALWRARLRRAQVGHPASMLAAYFVQAPVNVFPELDRRCAFCGERLFVMMRGKAGGIICHACIERAILLFY
jgi:hypothetical protein